MAINNKMPAHLETSLRKDNLFMEFVQSVKKGNSYVPSKGLERT